MRQQRIVLALLLLCCLGLGLAACAPGHVGTSVVGFIRDGQFWTVDPDGANAFEVVSQPDTPIVGFGWSPDHHLLTFRNEDANFAKTAAGKQISARTPSGVIQDLPGTLNTIGVDGGTPIEIAFANADVQYSTPQWNSDGSRLIFRQSARNVTFNPSNAQWWIAQNDQPGGIAAKAYASSYSPPSVSYDTQHYLVLGNATGGIFTTSMTTSNHSVIGSPLPDHPLPASLERLLWRPAHQNQSFLYANPQSASASDKALSVALVLRDLNGSSQTLTNCTCTQFAWSPDGNTILYTTGSTYSLLNLQDHSTTSFVAEADAAPYWSPDSRFLLLDGTHSLSLISRASHQQTELLRDQQSIAKQQQGELPATNSLLQPVPNSLWSADSQHFIFLTHQRLTWQGQALSSGVGLYNTTIDGHGQIQGKPALVVAGKNITQAGWTYQDPNTSFLYE
ncbi:TolB family protein [Dictyobacter arantiisoli]|uniref:Lipoprotein LpqB beta-propeller domain-containing protein n=1 Tax=Dictyobacter arantiisoli TaxID=2014874 RepID=A0A5A5TIU4_9CHLR|nr:hypothetical protein [Dictyobacter arantiisoli]GCF11046.1 hypothetical protein KDI_46100 [Dictyobacter arantiisoli]